MNFAIYEITYVRNRDLSVHAANERASSPVKALDQFHCGMQLKSPFGPDDYQVTKLARVIHHVGTETTKEFYDLPATPTPDLRSRRKMKNSAQKELL